MVNADNATMALRQLVLSDAASIRRVVGGRLRNSEEKMFSINRTMQQLLQKHEALSQVVVEQETGSEQEVIDLGRKTNDLLATTVSWLLVVNEELTTIFKEAVPDSTGRTHFLNFISIFILLTRRKATEALIHRVGNYPDLLPENQVIVVRLKFFILLLFSFIEISLKFRTACRDQAEFWLFVKLLTEFFPIHFDASNNRTTRLHLKVVLHTSI